MQRDNTRHNIINNEPRCLTNDASELIKLRNRVSPDRKVVSLVTSISLIELNDVNDC